MVADGGAAQVDYVHGDDVLERLGSQPGHVGLHLDTVDKSELLKRVLLDGPEPGLRAQVEAALAGKPVRLAKIEPTRRHAGAEQPDQALTLDQLAQLQPDDIFRRLWVQRYGDEAPPEQLAAFAELTHALGDQA